MLQQKHSEENMENDVERCDEQCIHEDIIEKVNSELPDEEILYDLAEFYKVFADSTRIKMLYILLESEMCVCDISQILGVSQSAVSHQLRMLKQMKLVKYRREGKTVIYSLSDQHIEQILSQGLEHISE
jgi:ArsR family transcriptional regulator